MPLPCSYGSQSIDLKSEQTDGTGWHAVETDGMHSCCSLLLAISRCSMFDQGNYCSMAEQVGTYVGTSQDS